MARVKTIGSGSSGNAYILECNNESLILECGVNWKEILKGLNYDLTNVQGCLVSHIHKDHSLSISNALKHALSVYSCEEVESNHPNVKTLQKGKKTAIGGFVAQPIPLKHSVECYGFLIEHEEFGRLVFATDCSSFPFRLKEINHFLIECNYSNDIIIDNLCNDELSRSMYENHLEINDCIDALKRNYSAKLQNVVLLHLSSSNADPVEFRERIREELCFNNVFVAQKGFELELKKEDF